MMTRKLLWPNLIGSMVLINYDVFSCFKVPKKRIPMNIPIDVTPNVEKENLGAKGDGNDIQLEIDKH